ncbi:MAG: hypothetical protein M5U19_22460 [Microthrixaceae bacterium]|nr:hypothetical protein [Microthrixaceae bacterium]
MFLGIGATLGRGLDIEGADADGVFKAIEFLINMNRGFEVNIGERVIVVGGGDVAMDAARTALRAADYAAQAATGTASAATDPEADLADERVSITEALDVARSAARPVPGTPRSSPSSHATRCLRTSSRSRRRWRRASSSSTVVARPASSPKNGRVTGLETTKVTRVFDEDGRFSPEFDTDDVQFAEADTVILAIGQAIDLGALGDSGPETSPTAHDQRRPGDRGHEHRGHLGGR